MPAYQLYDLSDDVGERHNVIDEHPDIFASLRSELKREVLMGRSTPGKPQRNTGSAFPRGNCIRSSIPKGPVCGFRSL